MKIKKTDDINALCDLARDSLARKNYARAESHLERAYERDTEHPGVLALLAQLAEAQGDAMQAIGYCLLAIKADPGAREAKAVFTRLLGNAGEIAFTQHNPLLKDALRACLETPELDVTPLQGCWRAAFILDPAFARAEEDFSCLNDPFFLLGLERLTVCNPDFEDFLTRLRRRLLEGKPDIALAAALTHYAFRAEYIFGVTREEEEKVKALRARIEANPVAEDVALYACYAPLSGLANARAVEETFRGPPLASVVAAQIGEHFALMEARKKIEPVTAIDDTISKAVREMYEESPYPRWGAFSFDAGAQVFPGGGNGGILVAGCGTGNETMRLALAFPGTDILAVDLSRTSLAYAALKAREMNVANVSFRQGDILRLGETGRTFDLIVCGGVLHHMARPMDGWRVLRGMLNPGGLMVVGLYSRAAHGPIIAARAAIEKGGYAATPDGIRAFRKDAKNILDTKTYAALSGLGDYYQASMCRDMLFHVQDHRYDLAEIEAALEELNLSFLNFVLPDAAQNRYRAAYPKDGPGGTLPHWREFEEKNPFVFRAMYQFWCRAKG